MRAPGLLTGGLVGNRNLPPKKRGIRGHYWAKPSDAHGDGSGERVVEATAHHGVVVPKQDHHVATVVGATAIP